MLANCKAEMTTNVIVMSTVLTLAKVGRLDCEDKFFTSYFNYIFFVSHSLIVKSTMLLRVRGTYKNCFVYI